MVQVQESEDRPRHHHQGFDRRRLPATDPAASYRVQRDRHPEPERRLHFGRAGGAGRRHRHRAGRQPVGLGRDVRSHPRHRTEVRRQGLCEPGFVDPVRRNDVAPHGLDGGGRPDHQIDGESHRLEEGHLRLRPPDGRRDPGVVLGLRRCDDRADVSRPPAHTSPASAMERGFFLTGAPTMTPSDAPPAPTLWQAFRFWLKLGCISFGGPAGQIAIMHQELVERRRWISERRFLHALNYCMLLPGPEAQQLATYIGWLLHRTRGGIIAGALFVLPSLLLLVLLSWLYMAFGQQPLVAGLFYGIKPAVTAI